MIKKLLKGCLTICLLGILVFLGYNYVKYKNQEVNELNREVQAENDAKLQEELLKREMEKSETFIDAINNNVALTVLRTKGNVKLTHDKTPSNNGWTEWLFNSDINAYADFSTAFTIETSDIHTKILEDGTVLISYDEDDIKLSSIDITNYAVSTNKSVFGSSYKPDEVAALEQIAHDSVSKKVNSETNLLQANKNLETFLTTLADHFEVKVEVVVD